ncbi:MAG: NAD-dependent malic enzyme [Acidobacteria bacterium]|nr:NAD-dependent malic enzyme [Acidobacteriota bacterium]
MRNNIIKRTRLKFDDVAGFLGRFATMIGEYGALFGEISTVHVGKRTKIRDIDLYVSDEETFDRICDEIRKMDGVDLIEVKDAVNEAHVDGKIEIHPRVDVESIDDLSIVYTPGVASVCKKIEADPELKYKYTGIQNSVAIVTNGTAILGLGDIGAVAGMPVMEGKSLLFKILSGVNGYPILIENKDPEVVIQAVKAIAPTYGAIKLEDIKAPECFEIEDRLDAELDIPVVHDDQHGTAVVVLSALLNIAQYTYLNLKRASVGIVGLGAAGIGISKLLRAYGIEQVYGTDINEKAAERFAALGGIPTDLNGVMKEARIVIATTGVPGLIKPEMIQPKQVILALSNPNPEITAEDALAAGAAYAADGRSVNNAIAFPGLFKGALMARATHINNAMKIAAATTIASFTMVGDLVPNILDTKLHLAVARAVEEAALKTGVVKYVKSVAD